MRRLPVALVLLAALVVAGSARAAPPQLQTSGRQIQTVDGQQVLLRGANVLRSEWDRSMSPERQAIPHLAQDWHGNIIVRGFAADPVNARDGTYLSWLDEYVAMGRTYNLYVAFIFRSFQINGSQPNQPDSRATSALTYLAQRYRNETHVVFGLQVEPHNVAWSTLRPQFEGMVDQIRGPDGSNSSTQPLIFVPGADWSNDISGAINDPVKRANVVYNVHPYIPESAWQSNFASAWDAGLPVHIGEFTLDPTLSLGMTEVDHLLAWARDHQVGWTAWIFDTCTCDSGQEGLITDWATAMPRGPFGTAVYNEMRSATPPPPPSPPTVSVSVTAIGTGDNQFSYNSHDGSPGQ